jgi:hypothetical protein
VAEQSDEGLDRRLPGAAERPSEAGRALGTLAEDRDHRLGGLAGNRPQGFVEVLAHVAMVARRQGLLRIEDRAHGRGAAAGQPVKIALGSLAAYDATNASREVVVGGYASPARVSHCVNVRKPDRRVPGMR